ncbi:hypothetical protein V2J09_001066 [Rumex salicifolius]
MEHNSTSVHGRYENTSSHSHAPPNHHLHHGLLQLQPYYILVIVLPIILAVLLISILILTIMLRQLKSKKSSFITGSNTARITDKNCNFYAHTTVNITQSPDMNNSECKSNGDKSRRLSSQRRTRAVQVFTYKELEMATDNFNEQNVIGNGGFGVVYRGVLTDGTVAAIKMLHQERKQGERAFRIEVDLLSRLHSPYLVELFGYCADQNHRILVFEFMINGSLEYHLLKSPEGYPQPLDWGMRLRIALDCARALEFLHEHASPSIIHRDFKCTNILLDHNFRAKVSDFSLAKIGSDKINGQISTRVLGTTGYLAPEYILTGKLTTKSDVYSYGVVLLQLITGRVPIDVSRPPGEHVLVSWALPRLTNREKVEEMVDPDLRGQYSRKDLVQVAAIAAVCVQAEADYRPLMTDVVQSLIPLAKRFSLTLNSSSFSQMSSPL